MNIPMILNYLRPGAEWSLDGNDYAGLTWLDTTIKPTEPEIVAAEAGASAAIAAKEQAAIDARAAALAHARSLGFTDAMIGVMYPNLVNGAEPLVVGRESLNIPANINNDVTLDTVQP